MSSYHNPLGAYTLTAYFPQENWMIRQISCTPGKSLQQVLEEQLPQLRDKPYSVYQFPSRSLLNVQRGCTSVTSDEITIELSQNTPEPIHPRLAVAKVLGKAEDTYLSNIQLLLDSYGDPLKKLWGLRGTPLNDLLETLSNLRDVLLTFYTKVEVAIRHWDQQVTCIGMLFIQYFHMLEDYERYYVNYPSAVRFLKQKKDSDPNFVNFIEQRRGADTHTLESLLLLPVSRINEYDRILGQLLDLTPQDHTDYSYLKEAYDKMHFVVRSREESIKLSQNESKLMMVQSRFHSDHLGLNEHMDLLHTPAIKKSKLASVSPSIVSKNSRSKSVPRNIEGSSIVDDTAGGNLGRGPRMYIYEGPVTMSSPTAGSHQRYMFLFSDLLIVAKPQNKTKLRSNLRLKERIALVDIWLSENVKECSSMDVSGDTSFVIGWPTVNYIVSFSVPEEKKTWFSYLQTYVQQQQESLELKSLPIHVVNSTDNSCHVPDPLMVSCKESASFVLAEALKLFKINEANSSFQLCVKSTKDDTALPLVGHEHPFSILLSHISQQLHGAGDNSVQNAPVQFVVRRKQAQGENSTDGTGKSKIKANLRNWYGRRKPANRRGRKIGEAVPNRVFGAPLDSVVVNGVLPTVLKDIMLRLYSDGPSYHGIFRKSANHAKKIQLKSAIEEDKVVDVADLPLSLVAALLTEFLRNVPGSVFDSQRYTEFVATCDIEDPKRRVSAVSRIISRLPQSNQTILSYLFPLLACISKNQDVNEMNSANLAICLAPTLLWPNTGFDVIRNEVPALIIFMIDYACEIFEGRIPSEYQDLNPSVDDISVHALWDQDLPSGEHDLSGYDELEPESEEGAVSDSQISVKMSPRKPTSRRYNMHKWPPGESSYKQDSETPEGSDEEPKRGESFIPPGITAQSGHWQPAKPRMRVRTSESSRDRKERRRTIGGIIDGELLGTQINIEENEILQNDIASLSRNHQQSCAGQSERMPYSEKVSDRVSSKSSRRRPSRRNDDGTVILGGLVGKRLVGSNEEFSVGAKSMETEEFLPSQPTEHTVLSMSGSDTGPSMGSNSSLDQNTTSTAGPSHPPLRHDSLKTVVKTKRKKRPVRRSNSLKEYSNSHQWLPVKPTSNTRTDEEKKAQSYQNIPTEYPTSSSSQHEHINYYCRTLLDDRNSAQLQTQQSSLSSADKRQNTHTVPYGDEGLGSSVSATPASTLTRDSPNKPVFHHKWTSLGISSNGDVDHQMSLIKGFVPEGKHPYPYATPINNSPKYSNHANRSPLPSVVKVTSFTAQCLTEKPKILYNYGLSTSARDGIVLTSARYKQIGSIEKPQRIYYGSPDYYTDL